MAFSSLQVIAEGTEGTVSKGFDKRSNTYVAIKCRKPSKVRVSGAGHSSESNKAMEAEARMVRECKHPNVIQLLDLVSIGDNTCAVFEYMDSDLSKRQPINPDKIKSIMRQLLEALAFIHSKGMAHQDVKPGNILVKDNMIKLADFGQARHLSTPARDLFGTISYMAPELLRGQKGLYSTSVDIWAAGCVFAELLLGRRLFTPAAYENLSFSEHLAAMREVMESWDPYSLGPEIKNIEALLLLVRMLDKDPRRRITAQEALASNYFSKATKAWGCKASPKPPCGLYTNCVHNSFNNRSNVV